MVNGNHMLPMASMDWAACTSGVALGSMAIMLTPKIENSTKYKIMLMIINTR